MTRNGVFKHWNGKPLAAIERDIILEVFFYFDGSKELSARALGLSKRTLYNRLEKLGLASLSTYDAEKQKDLYSPEVATVLRKFPEAKRMIRKKREAYVALMKARKETP